MLPILTIAGLNIPTYFLIISVACCLGIVWAYVRAESQGQDSNIALNLGLIIMITGFIGGRLFHIIYEHPSYYIENPSHTLQFWRGGFIYFGGFLTSLLSAWLYLRRQGQSLATWGDLYAPVLLFVYAIGRLANLTSGSGFGSQTDLPWGIVYPPGTEAPAGIALHPTPIYSLVLSLLGVTLLILIERRYRPKTGVVFLVFLLLQGVFRILTELFRGDYRGDLIVGLSVSTWFSLALVLFSVFILLQKRRQQQ